MGTVETRQFARPVVSVVIPARNCGALLPAAIASVDAQDVDNVEIVVVDDGSSDGTAEWLANERCSRPGLVVLTGGGDGPNISRNRAIVAAAAPLIAFLDADDLWTPGKLAAQLAFHANDRSAIFSFTDYLHVDPSGACHGTSFEYWPAFRRSLAGEDATNGFRRLDRPAAHILAENVVGTSTVVARREVLQNASGFDASLRSAADWDLWLRLARSGPVGFSRTVGTRYLMQRPGSVSANAALRIACMHRILDANAPFLLAAGESGSVRLARAHLLETEAEFARAQGRRGEAIATHLRAWALCPSARRLRAIAADLRPARRDPAHAGDQARVTPQA